MEAITPTTVLDGHNEADLSTRIGGDRRIGIANRGIESGSIVHHLFDEREMQPLTLTLLVIRPNDTHLSADNASFAKSRLHCRVEGIRVETLGRSLA